MIRIVIFGATGSHNVGDDILGITLQKMIQKTMPDAEVLLKPQHLREDIETADLIVIGGGGLIYDADFENVTNYTEIILRANDQGIPVFMAGIGVQYMFTEKAKEVYRNALRFVKAISVRNDVDADYLVNELGCRPDQIIRSRDLAFLAAEVLSVAGERPHNTKKRLVLSLADWKLGKQNYEKIAAGLDAQKDSYLAYVKAAIPRLLQTYDVQLVCQAVEDRELYEMLRSANPELTVVEFKDIEDSARLIDVYRAADITVTGRYHGLIASVVAGTPAIGVSFGGHKIKKLIDDSFPSLESQFFTVGDFVKDDILTKLTDAKFVAALHQPRPAELQKTMRLARKNYRLMKMIAGECAKM
jgi:polysaccharide pyruvyl transferase WcaK-like protein